MVSSANFGKSLSRIAFFMASNLWGTTSAIRWANKSEVATVDCIPVVLGVSFLSSLTTKMTALSDGQCSNGAISTAFESCPSGKVPISQATNPPKSDLHAEPEPFRAIFDNSDMSWGNSYNFAIAETNAAKPAADDAKPAAVGKLFSETMCNFICDNLGVSGDCSIEARNFLKSAKHA